MFGIYVHVPFCLRKCDYCDFYSVSARRDEVPHEMYLRALKAQLERDVVGCNLSGRNVESIYFGGGTPSLMPPQFFSQLKDALSRHFSFSEDLEVSCEMNPATVDASWFRAARAAGVNRCSIGVQSFQERLLASLGRIHSADDAMRAIAEAQDAGFTSVGMDLMYAIPSETMRELEDDVRAAMTFQPDHISAYQLTFEEGTPMHERGGSLSELDQLQQMRTVARMLSRGGWQRYEISNFAKPGHECRHNLNYWRYGEYLGLGAGAASFLKARDEERCHSEATRRIHSAEESRGANGILRRPRDPSLRSGQTRLQDDRRGVANHESRITNHVFSRRFTQVRDVNAYMEGDATLAESEQIDARTAMAEFCFLGLRTTEGISASSFKEEFGEEFHAVFGAEIERLTRDRLIEAYGDRIALAQKGVEISNQVFEKFLS